MVLNVFCGAPMGGFCVILFVFGGATVASVCVL